MCNDQQHRVTFTPLARKFPECIQEITDTSKNYDRIDGSCYYRHRDQNSDSSLINQMIFIK